MLLVTFFSEEDWGIYALVSNLGSLVLRVIFAPVEEVAYSYFSACNTQDPNQDRDAWRILRLLLLVQGGIGLLGITYGPANSFLVLRLLYGQTWANIQGTVTSLRLYCVFLQLASLNGILE